MSHPNTYKKRILSLAVLSALGTSHYVIAEEASSERIVTAPIVVTATRVEQNSFDLPVAIDVVEKEDIQNGQLQMLLSESLIRVPGITAQNRNNQAQDPQISSRGFGSRSAFGVRGIRVYVDGIPLTMPDGQGQPGIVDLSAIKSIEVMRGPFSALYGNSSGGVIQMLSEDAPKTLEVGGTVMFGSDDTKRQVMNAAGTAENIEYLLNVSNFETDSYRDHGTGQKEAATAKFKINISDATKLTALVNWFDQKAEDPLGLTRAVAFSEPTSAGVGAVGSNTRVYRSHTQVGFNLSHAFSENNAINLMTYVGTRENEQYLSLPSADPVFANGRASEISRDFWGTDLRWDNNGNVLNRPYNISLGLNYGKSEDARRDINADNGVKRPANISGNANYGLNRDEDNISTNFDQYIQGKLSVLDNIDIHAGARHTKVKLEVKDNFISGTSANGNNSGNVEYQKTTPVIGVVWKVTPTFNLYANYGKGFETPTFIEAAFSSTAAGATPNLNLKPSESRNYELGAKAFISDNTQANLNLFRITTEDELIISSQSSGRSVYSNAGKTKRTGAEFSIDSKFDNNISTYFSYSLLNAKFDSDFTSTAGLVESGNKIPGTYKTQIYGEIAWKYQPLGFSTAFEGRHNSKVYVNDQNEDIAPSYTIFNLRAGFEQNLGNWRLSEYLRVENMFDKEYIGSVRVGDANKRFYEPAADRNYLLGLSANYKF
ncbi:MAG: TonB-dependent receptor [Methylotenera sp.]|nr:TonB-dependent receptor [Methylotenera sp.]